MILFASWFVGCSDDAPQMAVPPQDKPPVEESACGNGQLDEGEICDGSLVAEDAACPKGYELPSGAQFGCTDDCKLITDACTKPEVPSCGNDQLDEGEICDGSSFAEDASCPEGYELPSGAQLGCTDDCKLVTDACAKPEVPSCGNGQLDEGEICDGSLVAEDAACPKGYELPSGAQFGCTDDCKLITDACTKPEVSSCGNGQLDENEPCDGTSFASDPACPAGTVLTNGQAIQCTESCTLDTSACKAPCGNAQLDSDEPCDGSLFATEAKCPEGTALAAGKSITCTSECTVDMSACEALPPCKTYIEYGMNWNHGPGHDAQYDIANGLVTWDGNCTHNGKGSYAVLSNGWKPGFSDHNCLIALQTEGYCPGVDNVCRTRITYADNWRHGPGHDAQYDEVKGVVTWGGMGDTGVTTLSNGWRPGYDGECAMSIRYTQCGKMYNNPVIPENNPDPGAVLDGDTYYVASTTGCSGGAYKIHSSKDLVNWTFHNCAFPKGQTPSWAVSHFWAPELHKVGKKWHIYFSAKNASTQQFCVGVGTADSPLGPYKDKGTPLVCKDKMGVIDASYFKDPADGKHYVIWKDDGNAIGQKTPVFIQPLTEDGLNTTGKPTQILINDQSWEGALIEGPWMIKKDDYYYIFYSGNGYTNPKYAIGVARSKKLMGPYEKLPNSIVSQNSHFQGPGHGSVIQTKSGNWVHVYHSWLYGKINQEPWRVLLVDRIFWKDGWPYSYSAPLKQSQPYPDM